MGAATMSQAEMFKDQIRAKALEFGFNAFGVAPAALPDRDKAGLMSYIEDGAHGDMEWMADRVAQRSEPQALWPEVKSVISLGLNYGPKEDPMAVLEQRDKAAISVYARGGDYHDLVKKRLKKLARWIIVKASKTQDKQAAPGPAVKVFVDTAPVLEKAVAGQTSLGWQGKHTNLVSAEFGSWLFLGEIFTTLNLPPDAPHRDQCGTCSACSDICPTDAFPAPYKLDARRCISYLTIENKGPIPLEFREAIGNRIYGCDDCLAVCPWNKFAQQGREAVLSARPEATAQKLVDYLDLGEDGFRLVFRGSPIKRVGRARFLRNVLIGLGNSGDPSSLRAIEKLLEDGSPLVRGAAVWAISRLASRVRAMALRDRYATTEEDGQVQEEWRLIR